MAAGFVLDASALICLLQGEHGADRVEAILDDAVISAVNLSEVIAKIVERGGTAEFAAAMLDPLRLDIVAFDEAQAIEAGRLRAVTRSSGLSFGDRACLALATVRGYTAVTADGAWAGLSWMSPQIELLRRSAQDPRP